MMGIESVVWKTKGEKYLTIQSKKCKEVEIRRKR